MTACSFSAIRVSSGVKLAVGAVLELLSVSSSSS